MDVVYFLPMYQPGVAPPINGFDPCNVNLIENFSFGKSATVNLKQGYI